MKLEGETGKVETKKTDRKGSWKGKTKKTGT